MIEMLTVIAIIAILAGILFPVFATVKRNVYKASCTTNLHEIGVALKLYKDEHNGAYPEAIYGFDIPNGRSAGAGPDGKPLPDVTGLYPQYVKEAQSLRCPICPYQLANTSVVTALLPNANAQPRYPTRIFPAWDSYDGQVEPNKIGMPYILKYARHWSPLKPGYADNPRQLLYKNPPEDTVVTWCTYHRDYDAGTANPQTGSVDLVLYLDGHVKSVPSNQMSPTFPGGQMMQGHGYLVGE